MKEGVQALGLDLFGEGLEDNWTVTAIRAPEGLDADTIASRIRADFGVVLAPGQGPLKGKVFRIGHFGYFSELDIIRGLAALEMTLETPRVPGEARRRRRGRRGRVLGRARASRAVRVLVTEKLSEQGLELLRRDFQVDVRPELATGDLAAEIGPYDALIVRSQTQVTAEVLEAARTLRVVARAGHRPRQRRRRGRHAARRDGRERPAVQRHLAPPSTRSRCCSRRRGTSRRRTPR